jgi:hypothetical protein
MLAGGSLKTICCVLRSGGDFEPIHVEWLRRQCAEHMPDWHFRCWSDMDVPDAVPLTSTWPKWWGKFEIYREPFEGPALVIDLDTVFVKPLEILPEHEGQPIFLRDFWRDGFRKPERLAGGFSYLPPWAREVLWRAFSQQPDEIIARWAGDDQPFIHSLFGANALRWQDHYIDAVVSYKSHAKPLGIGPDTSVVCFHGVPRPWDASDSWIPSLAARPRQEHT